MDNLYAEKFAIGGNEAQYNYDGSGINPDAELETPMEQDKDVTTFEDDPIPAETPDGGVTPSDKPDVEIEEEEVEETSPFGNIFLIGAVLLGLFLYTKKK